MSAVTALLRLRCAGRVLWLIPPDDEATGSSAVSEEDEDEGDEAGLFQSGGVLPRLPAGIPDVPLDRLAGQRAVNTVLHSAYDAHFTAFVAIGGMDEQIM